MYKHTCMHTYKPQPLYKTTLGTTNTLRLLTNTLRLLLKAPALVQLNSISITAITIPCHRAPSRRAASPSARGTCYKFIAALPRTNSVGNQRVAVA